MNKANLSSFTFSLLLAISTRNSIAPLNGNETPLNPIEMGLRNGTENIAGGPAEAERN
jgi:hypothetical protein